MLTSALPFFIALAGAGLLVLQTRPSDGTALLTRGNVVVLIVALGGAAQVIAGGSVGRLAAIGSLGVALLVVADSPASGQGRRITAPGGTGPAAFAAASLATWLLVIDAVVGLGAGAKLTSAAFGLTAILIGWLAARTGSATYRGAVVAGLVVITAVAASGALAGTSWRPCSDGKCSVVGALFTGGLSSENFVAVVAAMTAMFALGIERWEHRTLTVAFGIGVILATGSRTALLIVAACVTIVVLAGLVDRIRRSPVAHLRLPLWLSLVAGAGLTVLGFNLLLDARQDSFSNRGNIWVRAVDAVGGDETTGLGASAWSRLQEVGVLPQHFAHSEFLYLYFAGGVVALVLYGLMVGLLLRRATGRDWRTVMRRNAVVLAFAIGGLTEVVWNPISVDGFTWIMVSLLAVGGTAVDRETEPETPIEQESEVVPA